MFVRDACVAIQAWRYKTDAGDTGAEGADADAGADVDVADDKAPVNVFEEATGLDMNAGIGIDTTGASPAPLVHQEEVAQRTARTDADGEVKYGTARVFKIETNGVKSTVAVPAHDLCRYRDGKLAAFSFWDLQNMTWMEPEPKDKTNKRVARKSNGKAKAKAKAKVNARAQRSETDDASDSDDDNDQHSETSSSSASDVGADSEDEQSADESQLEGMGDKTEVAPAPVKRPRGRMPNARFSLVAGSRLHKQWRMVLRSKYSTGIWAGGAPPKCPEVQPDDGTEPSEELLRLQENFALRMLVAHCPWVCQQHIDDGLFSPEDLGIPIALVDKTDEEAERSDFERLLDWMSYNMRSFIGRSRNKLIMQLSDNVTSGYSQPIKALLSAHRTRITTHWRPWRFDCCMVDQVIGNRRTRMYVRNDDDDELDADAETDQRMEDFKAEMKNNRMFPTAADIELSHFLHDQQATLDGIIGPDEDDDVVPDPPKEMPDSRKGQLAKPKLGDANRLSYAKWCMLTENRATAPDPPALAKGASASNGTASQKKALAPLNASQQQVMDRLMPTIEAYANFNATLATLDADAARKIYAEEHKPVAHNVLVSGGPGTGSLFCNTFFSSCCTHPPPFVFSCLRTGRQNPFLQMVCDHFKAAQHWFRCWSGPRRMSLCISYVFESIPRLHAMMSSCSGCRRQHAKLGPDVAFVVCAAHG